MHGQQNIKIRNSIVVGFGVKPSGSAVTATVTVLYQRRMSENFSPEVTIIFYITI